MFFLSGSYENCWSGSLNYFGFGRCLPWGASVNIRLQDEWCWNAPSWCRRERLRGRAKRGWPARWRRRWWARRSHPRAETTVARRPQPRDGKSSNACRKRRRRTCATSDQIRGPNPAPPAHLRSSTGEGKKNNGFSWCGNQATHNFLLTTLKQF